MRHLLSIVALAAFAIAITGCGSDGGSAPATTPPVTPPVTTRPSGVWTLDTPGYSPSSTVAQNTQISLTNWGATYQIGNGGTMPSSITATVSVNNVVLPNGTVTLTPVQLVDGGGNPVTGSYRVTITTLSLGIQGTAGTFPVKVTIDTTNLTDVTAGSGPRFSGSSYTVTPAAPAANG